MRKMAFLAGLAAMLSGCQTTPAQQQATLAAVVSGAVCAADAAAVRGKALKVAVRAARDPACVAALTDLLGAGTAPDAPVAVTPPPG